MRVLVTGARGKVGRAAVAALQGAGHEVTATDLGAPVFERAVPGEPAYLRAELTDAGEAFALAREDASAISCAKAERLLGWRPKRSWRDYLDAEGRAR